MCSKCKTFCAPHGLPPQSVDVFLEMIRVIRSVHNRFVQARVLSLAGLVLLCVILVYSSCITGRCTRGLHPLVFLF